jgi:hypothetical protein
MRPIGTVYQQPDVRMNPTHTVVMYRSKMLDAPVELEYAQETLSGTQKRFVGREVYRPNIDLDA